MEELITILYKAGHTDKEIAEKLKIELGEVIDWRLDRKLPKNKKKTITKEKSTLRASISVENLDKMLLFLYFLDLVGERCVELGYKPDVAKFISVYRNHNLYDYMREGLPEVI